MRLPAAAGEAPQPQEDRQVDQQRQELQREHGGREPRLAAVVEQQVGDGPSGAYRQQHLRIAVRHLLLHEPPGVGLVYKRIFIPCLPQAAAVFLRESVGADEC